MTTIETIVVYAIAGIITIGLLWGAWKLLKMIIKNGSLLVLNGIIGVALLFVLVNFFDVGIPINAATVLVSAVFGVFGVGSLFVLHLFDIL